MEVIKQVLNLLLAAAIIMGWGMLWWKIADYIGNKLRFAELFLSIVNWFRHK